MPPYYVHHPDKGTTLTEDVLDALPEMRRLGPGAMIFDGDGVLLATLPTSPVCEVALRPGYGWGYGVESCTWKKCHN